MEAFTDSLLERCASVGWSSMTVEERAATRDHVLDTLAAITAGGAQRLTRAAAATLAAGGRGGDSPIPGQTGRYNLLDAAWLAAVAGHGLELDDGYRPGSTHPGVVVIPAVLALAHQRHASGAAVLDAVIAGYEAMTLVAEWSHPGLRQRGFHPTAVTGVFGSVVAACRLLALDRQAQRHAVGLAASAASGLFAFAGGGADVKRLHPGHAAREGLFAALLVGQDVAGPGNVLESRDGFFQAFLGGLPEVTNRPGVGPRISQCYIKPWPCCRHLHPAISALLVLIEEHDLAPDAVDAIEVETYDIAARHGAIGWDDFATSQLSFPFVMATALRYRTVELGHFSDQARNDPVTAEICRRVMIRASDGMNQRYRTQRPARVRLRVGERHHEQDVSTPPGSPESPISAAALEQKFLALTAPVHGRHRAEELYRTWAHIELVDDMALLIEAAALPA